MLFVKFMRKRADSYFFAFNKAYNNNNNNNCDSLTFSLLPPFCRVVCFWFSAENSICYKMCAAFAYLAAKIRDLQFSFRFVSFLPVPHPGQGSNSNSNSDSDSGSGSFGISYVAATFCGL